MSLPRVFTAGALLALASLTCAASTVPTAASPVSPPPLGLNIPWAAGGPRIEADGTHKQHQGLWPPFTVESIRLWDTRTAWLNLEPRKGKFEFDHLDEHLRIAQEHSVEHVTLVLWGTPQWAAKRTAATDPAWLGPGSASPPRSLADWVSFVTTIANRYRGQIQAYEIGNEVNTPAGFSGTPEEWAQMVRVAIKSIRAIDPQATLLVGGFAASNSRQIKAIAPWMSVLEPISNSPGAPHALSTHIYVSTRDPRPGSTLARTVNSLRSTYGHPVWVTEMNLLTGAPVSRRVITSGLKDLARCPGAVACYFYAWSDLPSGRLVNLTAYSQAMARALAQG